MIRDIVLAENISSDHTSLGCLGDIEDTGWENGIAVLQEVSESAHLQWLGRTFGRCVH